MISDYCNPTFVRDWRRLLHSKGYIILLALLYAWAWIILLSVDWKEVANLLGHMHEPIFCHYSDGRNYDGTLHYHSFGCYPASRLCHMMEDLNRSLAFCAMGAMALLIPLRVGNAVAADTKVKGTNFLQVTPLSARSIVRGLWLSAMSQSLVVAGLAASVIYVRSLLMPTGNEADWLGLVYLVAAGSVFSAAYIFISGLTNFLRFGMMAVLFFWGVVGVACFVDADDMPLLSYPWWVHGICLLAAALVTLLFLQLARRPYAAPAENCTLPVRVTVLLCLAFTAFCYWLIYATGYFFRPEESGLVFPIFVLTFAACFGGLADAVLPVTSMSVHAKRCVRWLPACIQTPGVLSSVLFLLLPLLAMGVLMDWDMTSSYRYKRVLTGFLHGQFGYMALCFVAQALVLWVPVVLGVWLADFFCRRNSDKRPLVVAVAVCVLALFMVVIMMPMSHEMSELLPMINIAIPDRVCRDICVAVSPDVYRGTLADAISSCLEILGIAAAQSVVAFLLLAVRVRVHRAER